ncbi:MAG: fimbrillin family protein [Prevotellaceae bacterium]|jgi:hypothetical protein|nr:fimbrillin family protein [Prevotellaceae bacterium]
MKNNNLLSTVLLMSLSLILISCRKDYSEYNDSRKPLTFKAMIVGSISETRASASAWDANDNIGVYMIKDGQALADANVLPSAASGNRRYTTTTGDGAFSSAADNTLYYPEDETQKVNFVAYYPYRSSITDYVYPINVAAQTSQSAIDLLYAVNTSQNDASTGAATLQFSHKLSKLVFSIAAGEGVSDLNGLAITLENVSTAADFNLVDGSISNLDNLNDISANVSAGGALAEAILIPDDMSGKKIIISLPIGVLEYQFPPFTAFESGKRYSYQVNLKKNEGSMLVINAGIDDWTDAPATNIDDFLTDPAGTQSAPFTIAQALGKIGQEEVWVEGYIVGASSLTKSFANTESNIVLSDNSSASDETNCIIVDLDEAAAGIQALLNIVDNPELIGTKVKIKGDIVNSQSNSSVWLVEVSQQKGVIGGGGDGPVQFFFENCGEEKVTNKSVQAHSSPTSAWKMPNPPISYFNSYGGNAVHSTSTLDNHIWLAPSAELELAISGISNLQPHTNVILSYKLTRYNTPCNSDLVKVFYKKTGDADFTELTIASVVLNTRDVYQTMEGISLPDSDEIEVLRFYSDNNGAGIRLDDITLTGTPK